MRQRSALELLWFGWKGSPAKSDTCIKVPVKIRVIYSMLSRLKWLMFIRAFKCFVHFLHWGSALYKSTILLLRMYVDCKQNGWCGCLPLWAISPFGVHSFHPLQVVHGEGMGGVRIWTHTHTQEPLYMHTTLPVFWCWRKWWNTSFIEAFIFRSDICHISFCVSSY